MIVPDKKDEPLTERRKPMQSAREYNPRQILVPLDMSELSDLSLKYAHVGAQVFDADITVLNAMHFEYPRYPATACVGAGFSPILRYIFG